MNSKNQCRAPVAGAEKPHGTRNKYKSGCRCLLCRAANARYVTSRAQAREIGDRYDLVSSSMARRHILRLSRQGVGRLALAAAADIASSTIYMIRSGQQKMIYRQTEERILSVSKQAVSDGALVPAAPTWEQIEILLSEGFTKTALALRLGYKGAALQLRKTRIRARNAAKVDRLFRMLMKV